MLCEPLRNLARSSDPTNARITNAGKGSNACVDLLLTRAFAGDRFISHRDVLAPSRPVRFSKEESLPLFGLSFEYSW